MISFKIDKSNKTCKTCEFFYFDEYKGYYICISVDTELGASGNRIHKFNKIRSCWHIGYDEYIKQKKLNNINNVV